MHTQSNMVDNEKYLDNLYGFNYKKAEAQLAFEKAYAMCQLLKLINQPGLMNINLQELINIVGLVDVNDSNNVRFLGFLLNGESKHYIFMDFFQEKNQNADNDEEVNPLIYNSERNEIFFRPPAYVKNGKSYWEQLANTFEKIERATSKYYLEHKKYRLDDLRFCFTELIVAIKYTNVYIYQLPESDLFKKILYNKFRKLLLLEEGFDLTIAIQSKNEEIRILSEIIKRNTRNNESIFNDVQLLIKRRTEFLHIKNLAEYRVAFPPIYFEFERAFKSLVFYQKLSFLTSATRREVTGQRESPTSIPYPWNAQITLYYQQSYQQEKIDFPIPLSPVELESLKKLVEQSKKEFNDLKPHLSQILHNYACVLINFNFFKDAYEQLDSGSVTLPLLNELSNLIAADEIKFFFGQMPASQMLFVPTPFLDGVTNLLKKPDILNRLEILNAKIEKLLQLSSVHYRFLPLRSSAVTNEVEVIERFLAGSPMEQANLPNQYGDSELATISAPVNLDTTITTQEASSGESDEPMQEDEPVDWELVAQNTTEAEEADNQQNKRQKRSKVIDLIKIVTELQFAPRGNRTLDAAVEAALDLMEKTLLQAGSSYYAADEAIDSAYLEKVTVIVQNRIRKYRTDSHLEYVGFRRTYEFNEREPSERNEIETTKLTRDRLNEVFKRIAPKQIAYDHSPSVTTRPPSAQPENKPLSHARVGEGKLPSSVYYGDSNKYDSVMRRIMSEDSQLAANSSLLFPGKQKKQKLEIFIEKRRYYNLFGDMLKNRVNEQAVTAEINTEFITKEGLNFDDLKKFFQQRQLQFECSFDATEKKIIITSENREPWETITSQYNQRLAERKEELKRIGFVRAPGTT